MTAFVKAMGLFEKGQLKAAIPLFQRALQEQPDDLNVIYRTVLTLVALRDYAGCAKWLTELLPHVDADQTPSWLMSGFHYNLGVAQDASGEWENARASYLQAITYQPDSVLPKIQLAGIEYRLGRPDEGERWDDLALASTRADRESRPTRAFVYLLRGDYITGFREYEHRWKLPQILAQSYIPKHAKRWNGQHLEFGKRVLVVAEQGVGDVLMMARYVPKLVDMGLRPALVVHGGLVRLMKTSFPTVEVYAMGEKHPQVGWWVPMLSLPYVFGTTIDTIPSARCITAPNDIVIGTLPIDTAPDFRVGYVQKGNSLHMGDKDRSCHDDAAWQTLLDTPGVEFVNLDEQALRERWGIRDMADTASIVAQCDLVISIDSAVAHLAGAMGKPVYLMPPAAPEWRWGMPRDVVERGSPWYPQHTLYRRRHVNDWPDVIARVRNDLEAR